MKKSALHSRQGFTVVELVTVVAIVGLLVGLAVPAVGQFVDNSRRSHDIALVENAIAASKAEFAYDYSGLEGTMGIYAFDAASGEAYSTDITAKYGQWDKEADYSVDGIPITGVAKDSYVSCIVIDGDVTTAQWGSLEPGALYRRAANRYADKNVELTSDTARERLLTDVDAIKAMAADYLGLTKDEIIAKSGLNPNYQARLWNDEGIGLFTYRNRNNNPEVRGDSSLLEELGFIKPTSGPASNSFTPSLVRAFFSDFMNCGAEVNIIIGKVEYDEAGKAKRIKAWVRVANSSSIKADVPPGLSSIYVEVS